MTTSDDGLLILSGGEVHALVSGRERAVLEEVRRAYVAHAAGESSLPHSLFLRFPGDERNRIIALPAYLGGGFSVAGLKWVSSFPDNVAAGMERASAVVILNSTTTGRPVAILEGSLISAKRTAASAALAAGVLSADESLTRAAFFGCGLINFEVARFLRVVFPRLAHLTLYDIDAGRASRFGEKCRAVFGGVEVSVAADAASLLASAPLVSFATTAGRPHVTDLSPCAPGAVLLHVSLRDLSPEVILAAENVVDDVDHVCRAQTSVHLAEQLVGNRDFIGASLGDLLRGAAERRRDPVRVTVFSPFGLGVLDLAVSKLALGWARERGLGTRVESFLPAPWTERE